MSLPYLVFAVFACIEILQTMVFLLFTIAQNWRAAFPEENLFPCVLGVCMATCPTRCPDGLSLNEPGSESSDDQRHDLASQSEATNPASCIVALTPRVTHNFFSAERPH